MIAVVQSIVSSILTRPQVQALYRPRSLPCHKTALYTTMQALNDPIQRLQLNPSLLHKTGTKTLLEIVSLNIRHKPPPHRPNLINLDLEITAQPPSLHPKGHNALNRRAKHPPRHLLLRSD